MGLVLVSGAWVPVRQAYALLDLLNHPGHADQSSHGRKGGGGDAGGARVGQEDFKRPGEFDTRSVAEGAARRLAEHWRPPEADVDAWIAEEARPVREYYADKSLAEKREGLAHSSIMEWQGSSGGPAAVVAITAVADRLGAKYELAEMESQGQEYLRARPGVRRAMESFGEAMYSQTQSWFAERGITHVQVERTTWRGKAKDEMRPFTSWSSEGGGGRTGDQSGSTTRHEVVPVERVFSIPPTGFGTLAESEFVLLPPLSSGD